MLRPRSGAPGNLHMLQHESCHGAPNLKSESDYTDSNDIIIFIMAWWFHVMIEGCVHLSDLKQLIPWSSADRRQSACEHNLVIKCDQYWPQIFSAPPGHLVWDYRVQSSSAYSTSNLFNSSVPPSSLDALTMCLPWLAWCCRGMEPQGGKRCSAWQNQPEHILYRSLSAFSSQFVVENTGGPTFSMWCTRFIRGYRWTWPVFNVFVTVCLSLANVLHSCSRTHNAFENEFLPVVHVPKVVVSLLLTCQPISFALVGNSYYCIINFKTAPILSIQSFLSSSVCFCGRSACRGLWTK